MSGLGGRRWWVLAAILGLGVPACAGGSASGLRLLVIDLPYQRVWDAALRAVAEYGVTRAGDGVIETGRVERAARPDESGLERVAERLTVRVQPVADLVTRVTVEVQAEGLRGGRWEPLPGDGATAAAVLARIRAAES